MSVSVRTEQSVNKMTRRVTDSHRQTGQQSVERVKEAHKMTTAGERVARAAITSPNNLKKSDYFQ